MTEIEVSGHDDLRGDRVSTATEKDRILQVLAGAESGVSVFRSDEWLWSDKDLVTLEGTQTLVVGRVVYDSEKAYLVTQSDADDPGADDPETAWVPKSQVRVYQKGSRRVDESTPQAFITDYQE